MLPNQENKNQLSFFPLARLLGVMVLVSLVLNYAWENLHAVLYVQGHGVFPAVRALLIRMTVGDAFLTLLIYGFVAAVMRDAKWMRHPARRSLFIAMGIGVVIAAVIEYHAVFIAHRWMYTASMPTVFGLGISPLLQMGLLPVASFWLASKIVLEH